MSTEGTERTPHSAVAVSAQGWHRIQLAVLGFVGLCGVLRSGGDVSGPAWVETAAVWLAVAALVLACCATYLVGRVAWPWRAVGRRQRPEQDVTAERTLRVGVVLTYVSVAAISLAALAGWWPSDGDGGDRGRGDVVELTGTEGRSWCGRLAEAPPGSVRVVTDGGAVDVDGSTVARLVPVDSC